MISLRIGASFTISRITYGLIALDNKSLANITRCVLESADKTNLSRFFSEAPWFQDRVNDRRVAYLLQQTKAVRRPKADAAADP